MNQSLTPNISSHGRSRGGLKNLENLIALDQSRHIYGTVTWSGVRTWWNLSEERAERDRSISSLSVGTQS